jgi:phosphoribosyl 1,2-cyclic phosphodiesterase
VHALLLEFNHDSELLANSAYPAFLKLRVGGKHGHLSNEAAADIARAVRHEGLRHVVAAHLSEQNNRPDIVRRLMAEALGGHEAEMLTASASEGSPWLDV